MRLSEILSKPRGEYRQVEGFLGNKRLSHGIQRKIENSGSVMLNYYCKHCEDMRTFASTGKIYAIGVDDQHISIDCTLKCPGCDETVTIWFLLESENDIFGIAPKVRIANKSERHSEMVLMNKLTYDYTELLEKAEVAYQNDLGAGSVVYLRKIFESLTGRVADAAGVDRNTAKGRRKKFADLLKEVDAQRHIIPREFSSNGYGLYSKLSNVIHGEYDEQLALQSYEALRRLVVGVLDNVDKNEALASAVAALGLDKEGESA